MPRLSLGLTFVLSNRDSQLCAGVTNVKPEPLRRQPVMKIPIKEAHIGLRTTTARKELWRKMAAREGLRLSEWLRKLADRRVAERAGEST